MVMQPEQAATERLHIQGYIHFTGQKRRGSVNNLIHLQNVHLEIAKGTPSDNRAYCTEVEKRVPGTEPFEFGDCPGGQGSKLTEVARMIKDKGLKRTVLEFPATYICNGRGMRDLDLFYLRESCASLIRTDLTVTVIWGTPGSGKSHWAEAIYDPEHRWALPDEQGTTWIDGYDGQRTLVIEDFKGKIPFRTLLRMLDVYPLEMQTKGGFCPAQWTDVIVTSNFHPNSWYGDDIDPWGFEVSALQRRISNIIQCFGQFPKSTCVVNDNDAIWMKDLPSRVELHKPITKPAEVAVEPVEAPAPSGAPSNPVQDIDVEELQRDWDEQDQDEENDFMGEISGGLPATPQHSHDPDGILEGLDGDKEPTSWFNLFDVE